MPRARRPGRIALVTDFGAGPYVGQIWLLLAAARPALPVIELVGDLAPFRPDLAAFLLPGLLQRMPPGTLYLCVVDPGVGTDRAILAAEVGRDWLVAPDNGLLVPLLRAASEAVSLWRIAWRPTAASATFHGRDIFTPIAQQVCAGVLPAAVRMEPGAMVGAELPAALAAVCYVDHYGNLVSGMRAADVPHDAVINVAGERIARARTFSDVGVGQPFWYENAFGLLEIAVNQGRADSRLGLSPGDPLRFDP
ncbi:MAG: SAM-dependent chlorinase/fluorinase [Thiohalocapsa sp.]|nr:SAM-dependent chlorinase/fluorinase [Thiohalocapsa sp.]